MRKIINFDRNKKKFLTITAAALTVMLVASITTLGAAPLSLQQQGTQQAPGQRVTSNNIVDGEVKSADIGNGEVTNANLADDAVTSDKIANGEVTSEDIAPGTIPPPTGGTPDDDSVTSAKIVDEAIASADIGEGQVGNAELADDAVTSDKIADGQVTSEDVANGAITSEDIAPGTIPPPTGGTPDDDSVTSAKIVDGAVASADIGDGQITTQDLANGAVTSDKIASGAIQLTTRTIFNSVTVHPNSEGSVRAECPPGMVLTGGGFAAHPRADVDASFPVGNQWGVVVINEASFPVPLAVYAQCIELTP